MTQPFLDTTTPAARRPTRARPLFARARLRALALGAGACLALTLATGCKDEKTRLPFTVTETPLASVEGPVPVFYTLINVTPDPTTVVAEVSEDGGRTFKRATQAAGLPNAVIINSRPEGERFNFFWDPLTDLGPGLHRNVRFRVFGFGEGSIPSDTAPFVVDLTDRLVKDPSLSGLITDDAAGLRLLDGSVVIAGGRPSQNQFTAQVTRFDPVSNTLSTFTSLSVPRSAIAAARLSDGSLLFAGGDTPAVSGAVDRIQISTTGFASLQTPTGGLTTPRAQAVIAPLTGGQALILGGRDANGNAVSQVELFSPGAALQAAYTSPLAARIGASATRLADGRVVLLGGSDATGARSDAAIVSGAGATQIVAAGTLSQARAEHGAVLLPDGRVFVAGGTSALGLDTGALTGAEIYDPATNATQAVANMSRGRRRPALVYTDGSVVAFGGTGSSDSATTAERYEFSTGTWTTIAAPSGTSRTAPTALTYGPGYALVVGGTSAAERYLPDADPVAISFELIEQIPPPRADHTATLTFDRGQVLIAGGTSQISSATNSAQLFNPETDTFSDVEPMRFARAGHAAALTFDARVLVAGGANEQGLVSTAEIFGLSERTWVDAGTLSTPRRNPTLTLFGPVFRPRILVVGGTDAAGQPVAQIEEWIPAPFGSNPAGSFVTVGTLPEGRSDHDTVSTFTNLFVGPGSSATGVLPNGVRLDGFNNLGQTLVTQASARTGARMTFSEGPRRVLISGGVDASGNLLDDAENVDVDLSTPLATAQRPKLIVPRARHRSVNLRNARVLLVGGTTTSGLPTDEAERFIYSLRFPHDVANTPGSFVRTADQRMNRARHRFTATLLNDGRVLIVGGVDETGATIPGAEFFVP